MNPYEILGVSIDASQEEIKNRYKILVQHIHPDKGGDESLFKVVKEAYELLSDPSRRKEFDKTGNFSKTAPKNNDISDRLSEIYFMVLQSLSPEKENLIERLEMHVQQCINKISNEILHCSSMIEKISKTEERLKFNDDVEEDFLGRFSKNRKHFFLTHKEILLEEKMLYLHIKEFLKKYDYDINLSLTKITSNASN